MRNGPVRKGNEMRTGLLLCVVAMLLLCGCHRAQLQLTITYDRNPQSEYPYASYGDVAKIYWTVGVKNFEQEVRNHKSITITVPNRTQMRATLQKFITDVNGFRAANEDVFFTADNSHSVWKL